MTCGTASFLRVERSGGRVRLGTFGADLDAMGATPGFQTVPASRQAAIDVRSQGTMREQTAKLLGFFRIPSYVLTERGPMLTFRTPACHFDDRRRLARPQFVNAPPMMPSAPYPPAPPTISCKKELEPHLTEGIRVKRRLPARASCGGRRGFTLRSAAPTTPPGSPDRSRRSGPRPPARRVSPRGRIARLRVWP